MLPQKRDIQALIKEDLEIMEKSEEKFKKLEKHAKKDTEKARQ